MSLYETERLIQELAKYEIDSHNIVVNQLLFPKKGLPLLASFFFLITASSSCLLTLCTDSKCEQCSVRYAMQQKYLAEAHELYDEYCHIIRLPLLTQEVRGAERLKEFSNMLVVPYVPEEER